MNKILGASLLVLMLSACSSTQEKAAIEDRGSAADASAATSTAPTGASAADSGATTGVADGRVEGAPLDDASASDPRKAPGSLLGERSVYFDFDRFEVKDSYTPMLQAHAAYLKQRTAAKVVVQGNTDERGSREYNLALGQKRAEAVRRALDVLGVTEAQIEAVSFGEEKPRQEGENEEAWAANRRADIVYGDE